MLHTAPRGTLLRPTYPIILQGGVKNYCDPETFHQMPLVERHPWHQAIGIHPQKVHLYSAGQWNFFERALGTGQVTGISEVEQKCTQAENLSGHLLPQREKPWSPEKRTKRKVTLRILKRGPQSGHDGFYHPRKCFRPTPPNKHNT